MCQMLYLGKYKLLLLNIICQVDSEPMKNIGFLHLHLVHGKRQKNSAFPLRFDMRKELLTFSGI